MDDVTLHHDFVALVERFSVKLLIELLLLSERREMKI